MQGNIDLDGSLREFDEDGRLKVISSNISKETINPYYGKEIPDYQKLGLDADKIYKIYRPGKELQKAADSFNGVQIVSVHTPVSADDPQKELVIGTTGTDAVFEKPFLKNSLFFWDAEAIGMIEAADKNLGGAKQLSCGYAFDAVMEPGEFNGESYDGYMTNIVGNHVALVERGRAGSDVKVSDINIFDEKTMKKHKLKFKLEKKIKAMDVEISPEKLDELIDTVIGVEDDESSVEKSKEMNKNPDPEIMDEMEPHEEIKKMLRSKGLSEDEIEHVCSKLSGVDKAHDEEKEEEKEKEKEENKKAMDSALLSLERKLKQEFKEIEEAKTIVRPIVGDVLKAENAEEIYRFALDELKVDHKGIKEITALKALVKIKSDKNNKTFDSDFKFSNYEKFDSKFKNLSRIILR